VPNRPHVHMRLGAFEFGFGHRRFVSVFSLVWRRV
jgi:hypothetical protein